MRCPVDNETLVITDRGGVEIDFCPRCRGVWLDRGELDKILDRVGAVDPGTPAPPRDPGAPVALRRPAAEPPPPDRGPREALRDGWGRDGGSRESWSRDDDGRRRGYDDDGYRRRGPDDDGYRRRDDDDDDDDRRRYKPRKRESFLRDLFDF